MHHHFCRQTSLQEGKMNPLSLDIECLDRDILVTVLDAMPVCVFLIEDDLIFCNRASEKTTGYDRKEFTTLEDFFARLFRDSSRQARALFEADREDGFPVPREYTIIGKEGSTKVVELTGSGSRRATRLICTLQDVTNCYKPERETILDDEITLQIMTRNALRESEQRYRFLSDLTSDYVYYGTRSGGDPFRVQWMGGAVQQITGYSEAEIFDRGGWLGFVHPEDRDAVAAQLLELRPGQCASNEFRIIGKNGQICWIRGLHRCEAGARPGEISLYGASRNITASKLAEVTLKDIEEIFRLFLEYSPAYLVFKDANHKILRLSRNFETLLGRPLEELVGRNVADIFPPENAWNIIRDDLKVLRGGMLSETEEVLQGRIYSSLKFPIPQKDKPPLLVSIATDMTERKEIEVAIKKLNARLDKRVAQRTAELEAAVLEQEAFSYSVSHDLRAPLRHINSFCAILQEDFGGSLEAEARRYLGRISDATRKMGVLIDELLELSRVSRVQMQRVPVNLSDLTARIALALKETEPNRAVEVVIVPELFATCDPTLVRQLLENLIGNAWKYTSKLADARIEFGVLPGNERTVFVIKDNGAGFDMTYKDKLFHPFQRLHGAQFEGNGIGLATAQRIVQRHGGSIWAEGAEGEGAQFFFTLP
jgi:PAS domain S-box-containing protein